MHREWRIFSNGQNEEEYMFKSFHSMPLMAGATMFVTMVALSLFAWEENTMATAVDIGGRLELFVDRYLVDRMDGVVFRMHEPVRQPLAKSPLPEGAYVTIIRDGNLYRAYYRAVIPGYDGTRGAGHPGEITCYAQSRDGVEWTFPDLGITDVRSSEGGNVILAGQSPFSHNFSPLLDSRPDVEPETRYKALAGTHPGGLYAFKSGDGIRWTKIRDTPVIKSQPLAFDSQNVAFWSEVEGCYVCYFRTWKTPHGKLRTISRSTSHDFLVWSKPVPTDPNLPGEHLYTSQTHPYFRAPHIYIALPTRYVAGRVGAKATDGMLGSTDILFMASRAGKSHYERLFTEAFIRPGLDPERWASRGNYAALNVVPTGAAEMSVYHESGHRSTLRTDGFISIRAGAAKGELVTHNVIFDGNELILNYSTSAAGSLRVEIQDIAGVPVPGFSLADCPLIVGDAIAQRVKWQNDPDLALLAGKPVRLRFEMQECDLYSFRFRRK